MLIILPDIDERTKRVQFTLMQTEQYLQSTKDILPRLNDLVKATRERVNELNNS
jgi:hypothetical protein